MHEIIENLEKVKLKLDEAFFYLDEIEELLQESGLGDDEAAKIGEASGRLTNELAALNSRVSDLEEILRVLEQRRAEAGA